LALVGLVLVVVWAVVSALALVLVMALAAGKEPRAHRLHYPNHPICLQA